MSRLLLVGAGHAQLQLLRTLATRRPRDLQVVLVNPFERQIYSSMLSGWIAGRYSLEEIGIPLAPVAQQAGGQFVKARLTGIDLQRRVALLDSGQTLTFDFASIASGSVIAADAIPGAGQRAILMRPVETFVSAWQKLYMVALSASSPVRFTIVGGGISGVEIALAVTQRLRMVEDAVRVQIISGPYFLHNVSPRARRMLELALRKTGVRLIEQSAVRVDRHAVVLEDGGSLPSDITVLVTGPAPDAWLAQSGLATSNGGFIAVNRNLQSMSHPFVFASGDCATILPMTPPKSGVYATQQGPTLAENVLRAIRGQPLRSYSPKSTVLYLIGTGNDSAVGTWGPLGFQGPWALRWKERRDRAFMNKFRAG